MTQHKRNRNKPKIISCDLPWCKRDNTNLRLYGLPFFGAMLMICKSHMEIYEPNSEALWRRITEGTYSPYDAL